MRNDLPETCFATLPGTGDLIILKRGETGYYRSDWETGDRTQNKEIADTHNRMRGITPAQVMAMQAGSMFGFDVPGADPQRYYDEAKLIRVYPLGYRGILDNPTSAFYRHIQGNLLQYQIAGVRDNYLELAAMPENMLCSQDGAIFLPDLVCGKPLVPVSVSTDLDAAGVVRMCLPSNAFTLDKEINAGYQIIAKVGVGPVEYALGEKDGKFPGFVTWERTPANDGDGPPNYYWGHYFDSREKAVQDFCSRASEKYKMLAEQRKPSIKAQLAAAKAAQAEKPAAQQRRKDKEAR